MELVGVIQVNLNSSIFNNFFWFKIINLDNNGPWYVTTNVNNRIANGVIAVTLANSNQNPPYRPNICWMIF